MSELEQLGEALREVFARERQAIAALDHASLVALAEQKSALVARLEALRAGPHTQRTRALFALLRVEAYATATLAVSANEAVRALLGIESRTGYNHRAKPISTGYGRRVRVA